MTIEEMKEKFVKGKLEIGVYSAGDQIVMVDAKGFTIYTKQSNGWIRANFYEYIDNEWFESETYERGE